MLYCCAEKSIRVSKIRRYLRSRISFHKDRIGSAISGRRALLKRTIEHDSGSLPVNVDPRKLEAAYRALQGYEFVLRKKSIA